jgi:hypothetical protein
MTYVQEPAGTDSYLDKFTHGFATAMLWANYWDDTEDPQYPEPHEGLGAFDVDSCAAITDLCAEFVRENFSDLSSYHLVTGLGPEHAGQDLALTSAGHGAGFWDRCAGEAGNRLCDAADGYGELGAELGDDQLVHFEY